MATIMQSDWDVAPSSSERLTAGRLVLLASLAALGSLATNIMLPAFPAMAREFGVAPRELAWTLSSFFVVFAVGQLFVGPLTDAVGRTPLVVAGLAVFLAGSVVCTRRAVVARADRGSCDPGARGMRGLGAGPGNRA